MFDTFIKIAIKYNAATITFYKNSTCTNESVQNIVF